MNNLKILALDFDGVICDGLAEYFQLSWQTYCHIWHVLQKSYPANLEDAFYRLRPVIEKTWEMPLLIRTIALGIPEVDILQNWQTLAQKIVVQEQLNTDEISHQLDNLRDQWIKRDLDGWLDLHRFYPGILEKLHQIQKNDCPELFIVTAKASRFAKLLLDSQGIKLPEDRIIGKECCRPKHLTLQILIQKFDILPEQVWFVEDRLQTLQLVQENSSLQDVKLYLVDWGYNTLVERESVVSNSRIQLLSLPNFAQDFPMWAT